MLYMRVNFTTHKNIHASNRYYTHVYKLQHVYTIDVRDDYTHESVFTITSVALPGLQYI